MQVGQQQVVTQPTVDRGNVHHAHTVVLVPVNQHGHPVGGTMGHNVGGMVALARWHGDKRVAQGVAAPEAVDPRTQLWTLAQNVVEPPG